MTNLITRINAIRREQPALQSNDGLRFHLTSSDEIIAYSKTSPYCGARVLVVVSLNPNAVREGTVCVSLPDEPVPDGELYTMRDLLTGISYTWAGPWNYVKLDPSQPGHIFLVERSTAA